MKLRTRNGAGKLAENLGPDDESSYMQRSDHAYYSFSEDRTVEANHSGSSQ